MKKRFDKRRKRSKLRTALIAVTALIVLGFGAWSFWPDRSSALLGGTPRLELDRTEINLGYFRFNAPAQASFTITNRGDGLLTLEAGRVRAVEGC